MIYTIVPIEQIMECEENNKHGNSGIRAKYMNEDVLLSKSVEGDYTIERLISTNPKSFLKKELFPGAPADIRNLTRCDDKT